MNRNHVLHFIVLSIGKDVSTNGKQWARVQAVAKALHIRSSNADRRKSTGSINFSDSGDVGSIPADFNLVSKRRICLLENRMGNFGKHPGNIYSYLMISFSLQLRKNERAQKNMS